jgi:guanylate kinase
MIDQRGKLFVFSAPSGAGKTTLVRRILESHPDVRVSISSTTRKQRSTENSGVDYFFIDHRKFEAMRDADEFLEHAEVFGNFYGTSRRQVEELRDAGHDVILEIDWQGAQQVRTNQPDCRTIFILPPSIEELERRLRGRQTDAEKVIRQRLGEAVSDIAHWPEFDHVVINDDLDRAAETLSAIMRDDETESRTSNPALRKRVEALLGMPRG